MYQTDSLGDAGKEHRRLGSLLPLPDHCNCFSPVHHRAASGIIVNTASQHLLLALHTELSGRRTGRQNDGGCLIGLLRRFNHLDHLHQVYAAHLIHHHFRTEPLCTALHFFAQAQPVDPGVEARIVLNIFTSDCLPANGPLLNHSHMQPCSRGI